MIRQAHGDLLNEDVDALVNTVNTVGVMGKGIALQFKRRFPENFKAYEAACRTGTVVPGRMFVFDAGGLTRPRWIVNFPTKRHWRSRSRLVDIEAGLDDLAKVIDELGIRSVALPPLGCGLGGLDWSEVMPLIEARLSQVNADIVVFAPDGPPPPTAIVDSAPPPPMTAGKAALVSIVDRYAEMTLDGPGLIEIQKLMYFLQVAGQPLRLNYTKGIYGPYADNLRHALISVEGHFLSGFGDGTAPVADGQALEVLPGATELAANVLSSEAEANARIDRVLELSEGFESAYGMELLATVHWAATEEGCADRACVTEKIRGWNPRKQRLFTESHIDTALDRLVAKGWLDQSVLTV